MTDAGMAKPRDGDVQDILAKPSTLIGEDESRAAGPLLGRRQYLHASIRQRNRQRPFLALLSFAARSGDVHTLALKSISDQSASNVSLVLVAVRISHSSGSEPIPSWCGSSLTNPWICSYRKAFWCCTASVWLPSNSFIG
jgi:hypothetical protein